MIVFAGPSIAGLDDSLTAGLDVRDPVRQGDVFLASRENPKAIGIIDGFFEGVPAVWHKEILWALKQGIAVLGGSSMGALRAAELDAFGMIGVGTIYQAYARREIEDDDEVALLHGPREVRYKALTLAMVNVRATLAKAQKAQVISEHQHNHLVAVAKSLFYKVRSWDAIFASIDTGIIPTSHLAPFRKWLAQNETNQKQADAALLLEHMTAGTYTRPDGDFHFERTALWQQATGIWSDRQKAGAGAATGERMFADKELLGG